MSIIDLDASALAQQIREGTITSLEATEAYIDHLLQVNPVINCMVENRFDAAREEAKACDAELARGRGSGRLYGVPISMKEAFDVAGMRTTGGLLHRRDAVASRDAAIVAKLKQEGAIILGKTNTPTLCFCQETENKLYGRTNNPWDPRRTAGGSSGGEGALIAAGGAAVGIGSDIGGSIRFPAHFNGVVGFKSGAHQVSDEGSFPPFAHALQERMLGIGAMAKSVRDARLVNEIIADTRPFKRSLEDFTITLPIGQLQYPASYQTRVLLGNIRAELQESFPVIDEQPPMYQEAALLWQLIMSIDGAPNIIAAATGDRKIQPIRSWLNESLFNRSDWHRYLSWALIGARMFKPSASQLSQMERQIQEGDQHIQHYLQNRLLILPVYHTPAPSHGEVFRELFSIRKTYQIYIPFVAYANTWGLPSLVVPVGEEDGLPVSVQIISAIGNEDAIFQLGERLEQSFRGWKRAGRVQEALAAHF